MGKKCIREGVGTEAYSGKKIRASKKTYQNPGESGGFKLPEVKSDTLTFSTVIGGDDCKKSFLEGLTVGGEAQSLRGGGEGGARSH